MLDVPCGGGVALRALPPERDVQYIALDIDDAMLARARARALRRGLSRVEFVAGDMLALPFVDGQADLVLSYSGLHMVSDPELAVRELARCLKPGGRLIGTTFLASRWMRRAVEAGVRGGALYDALIAATAANYDAELVSTDRRGLATCQAMGVTATIIEA